MLHSCSGDSHKMHGSWKLVEFNAAHFASGILGAVEENAILELKSNEQYQLTTFLNKDQVNRKWSGYYEIKIDTLSMTRLNTLKDTMTLSYEIEQLDQDTLKLRDIVTKDLRIYIKQDN